MTREPITKGRLRAQIAVQVLDDPSRVCLFCPAEVSAPLYQYLLSHDLRVTEPVGAIFGPYPQHELIVTASYGSVQRRIDEFISTLPEICYERDRA